MPRTYDEDGQPMMSDKQLNQMLLREIPLISKNLNSLEDKVDLLSSDIGMLKSDVNVLKLDIKQIKSDLHQLNFKTDQNHICLMTNQNGMEKRIEVLEAA